MKLTGIGDEAGNAISVQISAAQALGWTHLELRNVEVPGYPVGNAHEIPEPAFEKLCEILDDAKIGVAGFGSTIGNWASRITDPFETSLERAARAIPRMQRLGCGIIRVMSYAIEKNPDGTDAVDQFAAERFRRLRELQALFQDAGITMVHENCMNYGGLSIAHALETLENVPGLRWVFDTGNPVFNEDRANPGHRQDAWEFYQAVKPAISHIHIKDGVWNPAKQDCDYLLPGEGDGQVRRIMADVKQSGYDGFVSIEPHMAVVFHAQTEQNLLDPEAKAAEQYDVYLRYGRALRTLIDTL